MEIKIVCNCGAKYKFDIEPVNGRMPAPVNCPSCGADGTGQANDILRQSLPPAPPVAAPLASDPVVSSGSALSGLRLSRQTSPSPAGHPQEAPELDTPVPAAAVAARRFSPAAAPAKPSNRIVQALTTIGMIALVCFGAWRFGYKWFRRLKAVAAIASAAGQATADSSDAPRNENLWYEKEGTEIKGMLLRESGPATR